jgi:hypothetical protein
MKMTHSFLKNSSAFGRVTGFSACFTTASAISLEDSETEDAQLTDDVSSRTEGLAFSCTYNNVAQFGVTPLLDNQPGMLAQSSEYHKSPSYFYLWAQEVKHDLI